MGATPVATGSGGGGGGGSGTVTSVGMTVPAEFGIAGTPITTSGTLAVTWQSVAANRVLASPNGSSGAPSFRALVAGDVPDLSAVYAALAHNHSGVYSPVGHDHAATYAALSHAHAASDVTSGTFDAARIPTLDAAKIGTGTFDNARVNWAAPSALGSTTPAQVNATDVVLTGEVKRTTGNLALRSVDSNVLLYASNTLVGGCTSAARIDYVPATVSVSNTGTNDVSTLLTLARNTSDTAAAGFGVGMGVQLEDAGGTLRNAGGLNFILTGVTAGSVSSVAQIAIASSGTLYSALALRYSSGITTLETSGTCVISPSGFQVAKFVTSQVEHLKPLKAYIDHSALNTVVESELMNVTGSGTKTDGFGVSKQFQLKSETTASANAARRVVLWANGAYATRQADVVWYANDYGGEREVLRMRANGTAAAIGFLGATPVARAAHIADPSGGATTDAEARTAINAILVVLENLGLVATS